MAKFKLKFEVEKLAIEIEGERSDIPVITTNIGQQFARMVEPVANIVEGQKPHTNGNSSLPAPAVEQPPARRRRARTSGVTRVATAEAAAVEFRPDPERFGVPKQEWKTALKSMWLLYVLQQASGGDMVSLSSPQIVATFNKHFRQSGEIQQRHVTRDLGKLKAEAPPWIGENTDDTPATWYLTTSGMEKGQALMAEAKGEVTP